VSRGQKKRATTDPLHGRRSAPNKSRRQARQKRIEAAQAQAQAQISSADIETTEKLLQLIDEEKELDALTYLRLLEDPQNHQQINQAALQAVLDHLAERLVADQFKDSRHKWMECRDCLGLDNLLSERLVYWTRKEETGRNDGQVNYLIHKDVLHLAKEPRLKRDPFKNGTHFICRSGLFSHRHDDWADPQVTAPTLIGNPGQSYDQKWNQQIRPWFAAYSAKPAPRGAWLEKETRHCPDCLKKAKRFTETEERPEDVYLSQAAQAQIKTHARAELSGLLGDDLKKTHISPFSLRSSEWNNVYQGDNGLGGLTLKERINELTRHSLDQIFAREMLADLKANEVQVVEHLFGDRKPIDALSPTKPFDLFSGEDIIRFSEFDKLAMSGKEADLLENGEPLAREIKRVISQEIKKRQPSAPAASDPQAKKREQVIEKLKNKA
jgi:hypothetical protein